MSRRVGLPLLTTFTFSTAVTGSDPPQVSDVHDVKLQQGDMIVLGTDGLFDNIFDEEVAALATVALGAREAGFFYQGGKLDDVTVVVVFVEQARSKL
eukprot:jgi/Pico_ML_1/55518/g1193.t1